MKIKLKNKTKSIVVAGQIRIPSGSEIEIEEDKIPEGLKRLIGTVLEKV